MHLLSKESAPEDNNLKEAKLVVECAAQMGLEIKCSKDGSYKNYGGTDEQRRASSGIGI